MKNSRRLLLKTGVMFAGGLLAHNAVLAHRSPFLDLQDKVPALAPELVKDFVSAGHGNLSKVTEMLNSQPALLNATWDWGGGDFETAIEGAGHMGNKEIAEYLLSKGARMNIFCAAMLGKLDIVQSMLTAFPNLKTSKGPHGLMLLHHAKKGGDGAKPVLDYLTTIGAS
jgi:hypothetical protein